jgi:hypothetical protein
MIFRSQRHLSQSGLAQDHRRILQESCSQEKRLNGKQKKTPVMYFTEKPVVKKEVLNKAKEERTLNSRKK